MAQSFVALVALAALGLYMVMVMRVGAARGKFNVAAPATTGHPEFERIYRVQMNTLEQMPLFFVGLYLCTAYVHGWLAAVLGAAWVAGRYLYMTGYVAAPEKRGTGFLISGLAVIALMLASAGGVLWSFF